MHAYLPKLFFHPAAKSLKSQIPPVTIRYRIPILPKPPRWGSKLSNPPVSLAENLTVLEGKDACWMHQVPYKMVRSALESNSPPNTTWLGEACSLQFYIKKNKRYFLWCLIQLLPRLDSYFIFADTFVILTSQGHKNIRLSTWTFLFDPQKHFIKNSYIRNIYFYFVLFIISHWN